jgi:hypothetical protein
MRETVSRLMAGPWPRCREPNAPSQMTPPSVAASATTPGTRWAPRRIPEYRIDLGQGRGSKFLGLFAASECAPGAQKRMGGRQRTRGDQDLATGSVAAGDLQVACDSGQASVPGTCQTSHAAGRSIA